MPAASTVCAPWSVCQRTQHPCVGAPTRVWIGGTVAGCTVVAFILAEMGDKTQIATVALAAQYHAFFYVVAGTTLGMMIANVPAVMLGDRIAQRMPVRLVHAIAAAIFAVLGLATLFGMGERLGF